MQIELTMPCYYALQVLNDYTWRSFFADMQIIKKYGVDTEISDFDEFVDFYLLVNTNCYEDCHLCNTDYSVTAYVPKYTHNDLLQRLVKIAFDIKTDSLNDYNNSRMEQARKDLLIRLEKSKGAIASYYIDETIKDLVSQENSSCWRTGTHESLDYEYYRYLTNRKPLEECSRDSESDNRMRYLFEHA